MDENYVCDGTSQRDIQNGSFTLRYLRRTSERNSDHVPSWETFVRDEVLQISTNLVESGRQNPNASRSITAESEFSNGLAIELCITGIEVSEENKEIYVHQMEKYLKEISKARDVVVQTPRIDTSRGQQVREIQNETPRLGFGCRVEPFWECVFKEVAIVPNGVSVREDNSITGLYKSGGYIPLALRPGILLPLCNVPAIISIFVPECSFRPYLIPWRRLTTQGVHLMVATLDIPGSLTGLLPFLCESDVPSYSEHISRRLRIIPPVVNQGPIFHHRDFEQLEAVLRGGRQVTPIFQTFPYTYKRM